MIQLGSEIGKALDKALDRESVDGESLNRAYGLFWLWVIGTYEVIRTMCQAKSCFSEEVYDRLDRFKKHIATLRVPFAKQEYQGRQVPIKAENSMKLEVEARDIVFSVKEQRFAARETSSNSKV